MCYVESPLYVKGAESDSQSESDRGFSIPNKEALPDLSENRRNFESMRNYLSCHI
ncbi:MAG: hypothetical protein HW384_1788 [Dehalococcoidia bacterium]|nr:hypothetical protein [Dehalococcoidia bacterium]